MVAEPLYVSFLWHMHQPFYKDPVAGDYLLPWTYLHAVKDYYDMPAIVDAAPGAKAVFNLVPSLLEQLLDYAAGRAVDPFLSRARPAPADLGEEDRIFIIENFFSANRQRMIEPHKRYHELFALAGHGTAGAAKEAVRRLTDQDFLDLQVWFYLAWTGEAAKRRFPVFGELIRKGKHFTAADKALLFETQQQLIAEILPLYKRLHLEGKIELSVSPYFHPILPLLCDSASAQVAMPKVALPRTPYRHPEDAERQVARAVASFEELFGFRPAGMWPSEGAVSDEALVIMAAQGVTWSASDEWVLSHSLPGGLGRQKEGLYRPYAFRRQGRELALFFRDHVLSDLIGFSYSQWETDRAVADFVGRLKAVRQHCPSSRVVPIIMDGENAWEYYQGNGLPFLSKLYRALTETPGLQLATFSEALQLVPERRTLTRVHAGSWINANYGIWIGHAEKNLAWDYLAKARAVAAAKSPAVAGILAGGSSDDAVAGLVSTSLSAAQGSDWFWWYGDDHYSAHAATFDLLFRRHLMNVYRLLDLEMPGELHEPIKKLFPAGFVREPAGPISPAVTGVVTDYFEWLAAGLYDLTKLASAMHAAESPLQSFFYGFDEDNLYVRIDGVHPLDKLLQADDLLSLHLVCGCEFRLVMRRGGEQAPLEMDGSAEWHPCGAAAEYRVGQIVEARLPLVALGLVPGDKFLAYLALCRNGQQMGRWPVDQPLLLVFAGGVPATEEWQI